MPGHMAGPPLWIIGTQTGLRGLDEHVKRWLNEWDLKRLYPDYKPEIEVTELRQDYSERPELEVPTEDGAGEGASN